MNYLEKIEELIKHQNGKILSADIVRYIFRRYVEGAGCFVIDKELTNLGYKTKRGGLKWHESSVRCMIRNEKYKGDLLQGKTFTVDPLSVMMTFGGFLILFPKNKKILILGNRMI